MRDSCFVVDGHHRVAIAKQKRVEYVNAEVTELRSRHEIPDDVDVGRLIYAEAHRPLDPMRFFQRTVPCTSWPAWRGWTFTEAFFALDLPAQRRRAVFPERGGMSLDDAVTSVSREKGRRLGGRARRVAGRLRAG